VPGVPVGQRYGFRVDGPWDTEHGLVFNPAKLLLDPYAKAVSGSVVHHPALYGHRAAAGAPRRSWVPDPRDSAPYTARAVVVRDDFDWGDDQPRRRVRWTDTVVYELHVKGFTALHDRVPEHL